MTDQNERLNNSFKKLGKFTLSSLATTVLQFLLSMGKNVLFTRMLGPEGRGILGLLMTIPSLVVSFGNLGFGLGTVYLAAKKKVDLRYLFGNALLYLVIQGLILTMVGFLIYFLQDHRLITLEGIEDIKGFILPAIPLVLMYNLGLDLLMGVSLIYFINALSLLFSFLPILLFLLFWSLTGKTTESALFAWLFSTALIGILAFRRIYKQAGGRLKINPPFFKEALSFGLRGNVSMFANAVVRRIDVLFLAHYQGAEAVGYYVAAVSLAEILLALPNAVSTPFMPLRLEMDDQDARQFSPLVVKYIVFIMFIVCVIAAVTAKPVIYVLYGKAFIPSITPLLMLLPGIMVLSIYQFLKTDILSLGRPGLISLVSTGTMVLNLVLNWLLIPQYGPTGAAFSTSISYIVSTIILILFVSTHTHISVTGLIIMNRTDLSFFLTRVSKIGRKKQEPDFNKPTKSSGNRKK